MVQYFYILHCFVYMLQYLNTSMQFLSLTIIEVDYLHSETNLCASHHLSVFTPPPLHMHMYISLYVQIFKQNNLLNSTLPSFCTTLIQHLIYCLKRFTPQCCNRDLLSLLTWFGKYTHSLFW